MKPYTDFLETERDRDIRLLCNIKPEYLCYDRNYNYLYKINSVVVYRLNYRMSDIYNLCIQNKVKLLLDGEILLYYYLL